MFVIHDVYDLNELLKSKFRAPVNHHINQQRHRLESVMTAISDDTNQC
jgi:hypothetical protein